MLDMLMPRFFAARRRCCRFRRSCRCFRDVFDCFFRLLCAAFSYVITDAVARFHYCLPLSLPFFDADDFRLMIYARYHDATLPYEDAALLRHAVI